MCAVAMLITLTRATRVPSLPGQLHASKFAMSSAGCVRCLAQLGLCQKLSGCHTVCISSVQNCMYIKHDTV